MGNCADSCRERNDDKEAAASSKKKEANYMVGGAKNTGLDVKPFYQDIFDNPPPLADKNLANKNQADESLGKNSSPLDNKKVVENNNQHTDAQTKPKSPSNIKEVTLAQDLSYKGGFYSGDIKGNLPHGQGSFTS